MTNMSGKTPLPSILFGAQEITITYLTMAICGLLIFSPDTVFAEEFKNPYNWSGLYLGGFVGGALGANISTTEPIRLDNGNYWFRPFDNSYRYAIGSSFIAGGTIGYNLQASGAPLVLGVEGEYGYLNDKGSGRDVNIDPYSALTDDFVDNIGGNRTAIGSSYGYGLVGGRVGYVMDRLLLYVKSGVVFTNIETGYSAVKKETDIASLATLNTSSSHNTLGYGIGGGIEYVIPFNGLNNVSLKLEYLYLGIGTMQSSFGYCSCQFHWRTTDNISGINTVKLGLIYRFGAFAP
jgi:outer membrane immunogenic protein